MGEAPPRLGLCRYFLEQALGWDWGEALHGAGFSDPPCFITGAPLPARTPAKHLPQRARALSIPLPTLRCPMQTTQPPAPSTSQSPSPPPPPTLCAQALPPPAAATLEPWGAWPVGRLSASWPAGSPSMALSSTWWNGVEGACSEGEGKCQRDTPSTGAAESCPSFPLLPPPHTL